MFDFHPSYTKSVSVVNYEFNQQLFILIMWEDKYKKNLIVRIMGHQHLLRGKLGKNLF